LQVLVDFTCSTICTQVFVYFFLHFVHVGNCTICSCMYISYHVLCRNCYPDFVLINDAKIDFIYICAMCDKSSWRRRALSDLILPFVVFDFITFCRTARVFQHAITGRKSCILLKQALFLFYVQWYISLRNKQFYIF
jgi:hypothetical protein